MQFDTGKMQLSDIWEVRLMAFEVTQKEKVKQTQPQTRMT